MPKATLHVLHTDTKQFQDESISNLKTCLRDVKQNGARSTIVFIDRGDTFVLRKSPLCDRSEVIGKLIMAAIQVARECE